MQALILGISLIISSLSMMSCGTRSLATDYVELTPDQEARQALDEQNFAKAVELYQALVDAEPEGYERYPYLATSYAGLSGFDVFQTLLETAISSVDQAAVNAKLSSAVPANPTADELAAMKAAVDTLLALPSEYRDANNKSITTASSVAIQLQLYQAAYPLMLMNKFVSKTSEGSLDPERLATMTEEDALAILDSLQAVQAGGGVVGDAVTGVLATIAAQPGADNKEKLANYLATRS